MIEEESGRIKVRNYTPIFFVGADRSGKTTAAKAIANTILAFADPLKDAAFTLGVNRDKSNLKYRLFLRGLGDIVRAYDPDHLIKDMKYRISCVGIKLVIDDMRFVKEQDSFWGVTIRIRNEAAEKAHRENGDWGEWEKLTYCMEIYNDMDGVDKFMEKVRDKVLWVR